MRPALALLLAVGCAEPPRVALRTAAVYPTLGPMSRCVVEPIAGGGLPERGQLARVLISGQETVRRVAGLPGDRVAIADGRLVLGGQPLAGKTIHERTPCRVGPNPRCECRVVEETLGSRTYPVQTVLAEAAFEDARCVRAPDAPEVVVPPGHVFLLSDNRDAAADSRELGPWPLARLLGRVVRCQ